MTTSWDQVATPVRSTNRSLPVMFDLTSLGHASSSLTVISIPFLLDDHAGAPILNDGHMKMVNGVVTDIRQS